MSSDIGEQIVGAYLKIIVKCDIVGYNIRLPGGGIPGLGELDVVGFDFKNGTVYLCEVTTHIMGVLYGNGNEDTIKRIKDKLGRQKTYYKEVLKRKFPKFHYMFWSPVVPNGKLTEELNKILELELVINQKYTSCINELKKEAKKQTNSYENDAFRILQILEHLR